MVTVADMSPREYFHQANELLVLGPEPRASQPTGASERHAHITGKKPGDPTTCPKARNCGSVREGEEGVALAG